MSLSTSTVRLAGVGIGYPIATASSRDIPAVNGPSPSNQGDSCSTSGDDSVLGKSSSGGEGWLLAWTTSFESMILGMPNPAATASPEAITIKGSTVRVSLRVARTAEICCDPRAA